MTMKMLAATATLATMIALPASAQTVQQAPGARQVPDQTFGQARPRQPRAIAVIETDGRAHSSNPANDVYLGDRYMGSDPDPSVRFELRRDIPTHD